MWAGTLLPGHRILGADPEALAAIVVVGRADPRGGERFPVGPGIGVGGGTKDVRACCQRVGVGHIWGDGGAARLPSSVLPVFSAGLSGGILGQSAFGWLLHSGLVHMQCDEEAVAVADGADRRIARVGCFAEHRHLES